MHSSIWRLLLILFIHFACHDALSSYEFTALRDIFYSTGGSSWKYRSQYYKYGYPWVFSNSQYQNPCDANYPWQGIRCSSFCPLNDPSCYVTILKLTLMNLRGTIPYSIGNLTLVENIDFGSNYIVEPIPSSLSMLTSLRNFSLYDNYIYEPIPPFLGQIHSLQYLELSYNYFTGTFPSSLGNLVQLRFLNVAGNLLHGKLPPAIGNFTHLQTLWLAYNAFSGRVPVEMSKLTNLLAIYLVSNRFTGPFPEFYTTMPYMGNLILSHNYFTGSIPSSLGQVTSLQGIGLIGNLLTGPLPPSLQSLTLLLSIVLNFNQLNGTIPEYFSSFPRLQVMNFANNAFSGRIPNSLHNNSALQLLDCSNNYLTGDMSVLNHPSVITQWKALEVFAVSSNRLTGTIPSTICELTTLTLIDFSNNAFRGTFPGGCITSSYHSLQYIQLSYNSFSSTLPQGIVTPALQVLYVDHNIFTGSIPSSWFPPVSSSSSASSSALTAIVLAVNCLTGTLPDTICTASSLQQIVMDGLSASSACPHTQQVIFPTTSSSSFIVTQGVVGTLPSCLFQLPGLSQLQLSGNLFTGTLPDPIKPLSSSLTTLVLSNNQLSGSLPHPFWNHTYTNTFDISFNRFRDTFPTNTILSTPSNSNITHSFHVNRLSGDIPSSFLSYATVNMLEGNLFSCGSFLSPSTTAADRSNQLPSNDPNYQSYDCGSNSTNVALVVWGVIGVAVYLLMIGVFVILRQWTPTYDLIKGALRIVWQWIVMKCILGNDTTQQPSISIDTIEKHILSIVTSDSTTPSTPIVHIWVWYAVYDLIITSKSMIQETTLDSRMYHILQQFRTLQNVILVNHFYVQIIRVACYISCFAWICLLPLYIWMSDEHTYSTYKDSYVWIVSASYVSGFTPAIVLFVCLTCLLVVVITWLYRCLYATDTSLFSSSTSSNSSGAPEDSMDDSITDIASQNTTVKHRLILYSKYAFIFLLNAVIVMTVNIAYVYVVVNGTYNVHTIALISFVVSIFKIIWNHELLGGTLYRDFIRSILQVELSGETFLLISLFNNIVVPYVAEMCVSPYCFLYIIESIPQISFVYPQIVCTSSYSCATSYCTISIVCDSTTGRTITSAYTPPFSYSYLCSSSLMSTFVEVFIYRYIISGIISPCLLCLNIYLQNKFQSQERSGEIQSAFQAWIASLQYLSVPTIWRVTEERMNTLSEQSSPEDLRIMKAFHRTLHRSEYGKQLCVEIITDFAILLSFGILFPPLMILIVHSMFVHYLVYIAAMGRWGFFILCTVMKSPSNAVVDTAQRRTNNSEDPAFMESNTPQQQSTELLLSAGLLNGLLYFNTWKLHECIRYGLFGVRITVLLSALFWSFALFDTLGDEVGYLEALWILIVTAIFPILVYAVVVGVHNWKGFSKQNDTIRMSIAMVEARSSPAGDKSRNVGDSLEHKQDSIRHVSNPLIKAV